MSRVIELERAANLVATSKPMPARRQVDEATGAVVNDVIRELQACYTAWRQAAVQHPYMPWQLTSTAFFVEF